MNDDRPNGGAAPGEPTPKARAEEFAAALEREREQRAVAERDAAEARSTMNRRDFIGFVVGLAGGVVAGGLAGVGIGHWLAEDNAVEMVSLPDTGNEGVIGGGDALIFYPRIKVAALSSLQEGVPVPFQYPLEGQNAEIVKLGKPAKYGLGPDGDVVAFSTICTHMGWPLGGTFRPGECVYGPCPGHFSTFDASVAGQVTLGQATQKLPQIVLAIEGDDIFAEGVLGLVYGYRDNLKDGTPVEVAT